MDDHDRLLWQRISAHPLDFLVGKLQAEQRWSPHEARSAVEEYRRFCLLAVGSPGAVPSDEVDQVWHLHLTHSRDYWQRFCPEVLGRALHHEPGPATLAMRERYAATLAAYDERFGPPPVRWWPGTRDRFAVRRVSVDLGRYWLLPRPRVAAIAAMALVATGLLALPRAARAALPTNPLDWSGPPFLALYLVLMVAGYLLTRRWRNALREGPQPPHGASLAPLETALLAGGPRRVVDAAVAGMLGDGRLIWDTGSKRLSVPSSTGVPTNAVEARVLERVRLGDGRVPVRAQGALAAAIDSIGEPLQDTGMWLDATQAKRAALRPLLIPLALLLLGAAKLALGLERHRPIELLILLMIVTAVASLAMAFKTGRRSCAGDDHLETLRSRLDHRIRAPRSAELAMAVALGGTAAMAGTAYAGYHERLRASGDASGCGSSGDGGGGGGSNGCGGCSGGGD